MRRWMQPLRSAWESAFSTAPRLAIVVTRSLYFWGLVARAYFVRRGALVRRANVPGRAPMPAAPNPSAAAAGAAPKRLSAAAAGHA